MEKVYGTLVGAVGVVIGTLQQPQGKRLSAFLGGLWAILYVASIFLFFKTKDVAAACLLSMGWVALMIALLASEKRSPLIICAGLAALPLNIGVATLLRGNQAAGWIISLPALVILAVGTWLDSRAKKGANPPASSPTTTPTKPPDKTAPPRRRGARRGGKPGWLS